MIEAVDLDVTGPTWHVRARHTLHSKLSKLTSFVHSYKFGALSQFSEKFRQFCTLVSPKIKET